MGELIDGHWRSSTSETATSAGTFERKPSIFRSWVYSLTGRRSTECPAFQHRPLATTSTSRWHRPWAHHALIMRSLKGAEHPRGHVRRPLATAGEEGMDHSIPARAWSPTHRSTAFPNSTSSTRWRTRIALRRSPSQSSGTSVSERSRIEQILEIIRMETGNLLRRSGHAAR